MTISIKLNAFTKHEPGDFSTTQHKHQRIRQKSDISHNKYHFFSNARVILDMKKFEQL